MKKCNGCFKEKSFSEFGKRSQLKDGMQSRCKHCVNLYKKKWKKNNYLRVKELQSKYVENNKEKVLTSKRVYAENNKEKVKLSKRKWVRNNPAKSNAKTAQRRANKHNATPKWLDKSQSLEITRFYRLAKELQWLSEEPLVVDHIVPLRGENVSGLHVLWNLQILTRSLNSSKGNKF